MRAVLRITHRVDYVLARRRRSQNRRPQSRHM
jgi:hypothetical protein